MSELISREDALKVIRRNRHRLEGNGQTYQFIIDQMEHIPDVELPNWVPCSERLPEYRRLVDVTTRDLRVKLAYLDSVKEDGTDDLWVMPLDDADCALWNVVAWKPRPEPWKGAEHE